MKRISSSVAVLAAALLAPQVLLAGPVNVNTADAETLARELNGVPLDPAARAAAPQDVAVVDLGSGEVLDRFSTTAVESRASGIDCNPTVAG